MNERIAVVNDGNETYTQYRCVFEGCGWVGTQFPHEENPNAVNDAVQEALQHSRTSHS